jgi:hypothetical protein
MKNAYKILVRKPAGNKPLERLGRISEDNIKLDLGETWLGMCVLDSSASG